ncbi:MAG: DNA-3-methyladenine glycosylase [Acidothermales bacterium]|jgi:DNA-3-methyladenine glycosylase|nr:DNA-3-methyladenine glycosylase [Acidothermales bacterium]
MGTPLDTAGEVVPRAFFDRPVLTVAPDLLGRVIAHTTREGVAAVRLTEVEAYDGERDPGSHAYRGPTPRNAVMFGPPGHLYVYFTYGMHWCANAVCGPSGSASAVLLRAGEVVEGMDVARRRREERRQRQSRGPVVEAGVRRPVADHELARGPARLTTALGLDGTYNGADVCVAAAPLCLRAGWPPTPGEARSGPRTGVGGPGAALPWRFFLDGERSVSPYRPAVPRRRRSP